MIMLKQPKTTGVMVFCLLFAGSQIARPAEGDDWIRRISGAMEKVARGRNREAVEQVVPVKRIELPAKTRIYAGIGGAGLSQPVPGSASAGLDTRYHARASLDHNLRFAHRIRTTVGNRYIKNTTAVDLPGGSRK